MLGAFTKRTFDVVVGGLLLLVVLPVILICAIGTAVALKTWPFFRQERIGRDGRMFHFFKLRTLPAHAPAYASKYELVNLHVPAFTLALRRLHVDELPQLLLVVLGKMSLVGPRPEMAYLCEEFTPEFAARRASVRPGCTGLWQVSEACTRMIYEDPEFDAYYIANRSLRFDLWIMYRTVRMHLPESSDQLTTLAELPAWSRRKPVAVPATVTAIREPMLEPLRDAPILNVEVERSLA